VQLSLHKAAAGVRVAETSAAAPAASVANTRWNGWDDADQKYRLQLEAAGRGTWTTADNKQSRLLTWKQQGSVVTMTFSDKSVLKAVIAGRTMSGYVHVPEHKADLDFGNGRSEINTIAESFEGYFFELSDGAANAGSVVSGSGQLTGGIMLLKKPAPAELPEATGDASERVKQLIEILKTGSSNTRKAAAEELATMGNDALPAVPYLVQIVGQRALTPPEALTAFQIIGRADGSRVAAARALKKLDEDKLIPALEQARQCPSIHVQRWAAQSINNLKGVPNNPPANQPKKFYELKNKLKM
jgi:hypothetical protein